MKTSTPVFETQLDDIPLYRRGKVRDMYSVGDQLLMVATDRISAYDFVLGSGIPDKGKVLTQLSAFWFERTRGFVANHLITTDVTAMPDALHPYADVLAGRSMLVERTRPILIECVARGYLAGSGWKEYQGNGRVCGVELPPGLTESDRLPTPIFTPATKASDGHDINISEQEAAELVGGPLVERLRGLTLSLYEQGARHAAERGIIVADTKFEFGLRETEDGSEEIVLIDEVLTPDSSRFWPQADYAPGRGQISFDKQFVRDYLDAVAWNRQPPVPDLPAEVVGKTREKYLEAYRSLTSRELA